MVLYRLLTWMIAASLMPLLALRGIIGLSPLPARMRQRMIPPARPDGAARLIWLHGASNGELTAARPVIEAITRRARHPRPARS